MSPPARGLRPGPYVVVADEDPQLLDLMVRALRDDGCCVFQAYDGRAALELSLALPAIHLLITNTRMPGLEGPELIRRVREQLPGLPILYVRNQGETAGPSPDGLPPDVPTLAEPFTQRQLLEAVHQLLGRDD